MQWFEPFVTLALVLGCAASAASQYTKGYILSWTMLLCVNECQVPFYYAFLAIVFGSENINVLNVQQLDETKSETSP